MNDNKLQNGTNPILNLKFIIIGDPGVGKTSLLHYFIFNKCIISINISNIIIIR